MKNIIFVLFLFVSQNSMSDVLFTLSPSSVGGVNVVGTGTGSVTESFSGVDIDFLDYDGNFLSNSLGIDIIRTLNADGVIRNLTTSDSSMITTFSVDNDVNSGDDIDFQFIPISFSEGDLFDFELTATFEPELLLFSALNPGVYNELSVLGGKEIFGSSTLLVTPIPSAFYFLLSALALLIFNKFSEILHP